MGSVSKYVGFSSNEKLRITSIELWNESGSTSPDCYQPVGKCDFNHAR
jgi:hypothetical protein